MISIERKWVSSRYRFIICQNEYIIPLIYPSRMESQFNNPEFSDVTLDLVNTETKEHKSIYSHKVILSAHSDFFHRLFQPGFREANQTKVHVEVPDINMAERLIHWMYTKDRFIPDDDRLLAEMWLMRISPVEEIPYPGIQGEFIHEKGDWNKEFYSGASLNREISYQSITPNSTIKEFSILGYSDGHIRVGIKFPERIVDELDNYLKQYNIDMGIDRLCKFYITSSYNLKQTKLLAEIVIKHNHFGEKDLEVIKGILGKN